MGRTIILPLLLFIAWPPRPAHAQAAPQATPPQPPSAAAPPPAVASPAPEVAGAGGDPKKRAARGAADAQAAAAAPAQPAVAQPAEPSGPSAQEEKQPAATTAPEVANPTEAAPISAQPEVAASAASAASPSAEVEPEDEQPKVPWMASLSWGQAFNVAGMSRSAFQTYNPEYAWSFTLALGYRFDKLTSIALSQALAVELTDSDITNTRQEMWLLDTAIDARRKLLRYEPAIDQAFQLSGKAGVLLPTSKASQAATMLLAGRVQLGAEYELENVLHGLSAGTSVSYAHRFLRSNTVEVDGPYPCDTTADDLTQNCSHLGSLTNTREVFVLALDGSLGLTDQLKLGAQLSFGWNLGSRLPTERVMLPTGSVVTLEDDSLTRWRNSRVLGLSLEYGITDWFSATALFTNSFAERASDGQYRAPLHPLDTVLGLELSVSFDQLYAGPHGDGEDR